MKAVFSNLSDKSFNNESIGNIKDDLGIQTIVDEAIKRGIPVENIPMEDIGNIGMLILGVPGQQIRVGGGGSYTYTEKTSHLAVRLCKDKFATKQILRKHGMPVPHGEMILSESAVIDAFHRLGGVVAVKPYDGNTGKGVRIGLTTDAQVVEAFKWARSFSAAALIERYCAGQDYRVLVCDGKVIAVSERSPPTISGNGVDTIAALIEQLNGDPRRGADKKFPMTRVEIDQDLIWNLNKVNLTLENVLEPDSSLQLRSIANLSVGASTTDRTDEIHPDNAQLAINATSIVGLDICGVDLISRDISKSYKDEELNILEMNANPGIRSHLRPSNGQSRDVAGAILDYLFPGTAQGK